MTSARPPPPGRARRPALIAAGAALALAVAFGAGRWTGAPPPAPPAAAPGAAPAAVAPPEPAAATSSEGAEPRPADLTGAVATAATPPEAPPVAARPPAQRMPLPPDLQARLRAGLGADLEARRPEDLARCWPSGGLPRGLPSTTVTYDLTFDPAGREVARGLSDDRRAPAGALGHCLSRSPGAPLAIPPQGTFVSLRIPVSYP